MVRRTFVFGMLGAAPQTAPEWRKEIGAGFAGPVLAQGRLIVFFRSGGLELVEAWDSRTGAKQWSTSSPTRYRDDFGFDEGPRSAVAVADGRVFSHGAEGLLQALDLASGKRLWSVATMEKYGVEKNFFGAAGTPLVYGDLVMLNVGGKAGAGVVAFDAASGREKWKATSDEASYSSGITASLNGVPHAFFLTRNGLAALHLPSGKVAQQVRWRSRSRSSVNAASPVVVGDEIFVSASYGTGAAVLRAQGPVWQPLWESDEALSNHYATSVCRDGNLYGFHGRQEEGQVLRCVEWKSGKVKWSVDSFGAGTVTLRNDRTLLLVRESGEVVEAEASPQAYKRLGSLHALPGVVRAYPALDGNTLFVRNEKTLACVDLSGLH
jgi:outer membrane protein assembly factor BamB